MMRQERLRLCEEDAHGAVDRIGHVVLCVRGWVDGSLAILTTLADFA